MTEADGRVAVGRMLESQVRSAPARVADGSVEKATLRSARMRGRGGGRGRGVGAEQAAGSRQPVSG